MIVAKSPLRSLTLKKANKRRKLLQERLFLPFMLPYYAFGSSDDNAESEMGGIVGFVVGLAVAVFGFCTMRNPMRFTLLSPWSEGYYQRMVLDTTTRNWLRILGVLICLFGAGILTASIGAILKANSMQAVSDGLWALLGLVFVCALGAGLIQAVRQLFKMQLFDWFRMWKVSAELGPINIFPAITPKMQREANLFTVVLLGLACVAVAVSLLR